MRILWQVLTVLAISSVGRLVIDSAGSSPGLTLLAGLAAAAGMVAGYVWIVRRTERRPVVELGRDGAPAAVGVGAGAGIALFALVIAVIALSGSYHVSGWGSFGGFVWLLGSMVAVAVSEELIFRGVLFRHVEGRFGTWTALVGTGLLFGLAHLLNPEATVWGAIAIAVEAGGMLGAAYILTRRLWLPIGLHFGWNFAESGIFGTDVSGTSTHHGLLDAATSGPAMVSGGQFGPEASVYAVLSCLAVAAALLVLARRRGLIVPRRGPTRTAAAMLGR